MSLQQISIFLRVFFLIFLIGCSEPGKTEKSEKEQSSGKKVLEIKNPAYGGTFTVAMLGEPSNLLPFLSSDSASTSAQGLIYTSLLQYNKDLELVPHAAKSFTMHDAGRRIAFVLHEGIKWSDGRELTAEDVAFTYKTMIDPKVPTAYGETYKLVKEFKITGRYSFEVVYEKPYAKALASWSGAVLPKHVLEKENLINTPLKRKPVTNGPYTLKKWDSGRHLIFEANPDYFAGRPYFDRVVYRIIPDQSTQFLELRAKNLDRMDVTPLQYKSQIKGSVWERNFNKYKYQSFSYTYLGYNLENPLFQDKKVRQALAHAIDKKSLVKGVLLGLGVPAIGPFKPGTFWENTSITDYPYDGEKATALLAEAGFKEKNADGILEKDGRPFVFTIVTNQGNAARIKAATIIQKNLKPLGITVKIRTVEWAVFLEQYIRPGKFDATILGWNTPIDPDLYNVWHSSRARPGGLNFIHYKNEELDSLVDEARFVADKNKRKKMYDRVQEILHKDQPYTFLYSAFALPVVSSRIKGISPAQAGIDYNFEQWWIPKSMQKTYIQE